MDPSIERVVEKIVSDKTHGATQLAAMGLDLVACACASVSGLATDEALEEVTRLTQQKNGLRPSMAAPGSWALTFPVKLRERLKHAPRGNIEAAGREVSKLLMECLSSHTKRMAEAARPMLANARLILTLSDSSLSKK